MEDRTYYKAQNGVELRLKQVPDQFVFDAQARLKPPKVPSVYISEKDRVEENPNHPDYKNALDEYRTKQNQVVFNTYFVLGITVISLPDDVPPLESSDWVDTLQGSLYGLDGVQVDIPDNGPGRKLAWVKYVLLPTMEEQGIIIPKIAALSGGTVAAEVELAVDSFRGDESGSTTERVDATAQAPVRDNDGATMQLPNSRVRSTRSS